MPIATDRPKRVLKRPLTYWEEYVETDEWYLQEMLQDVPMEEMHAALVDSDFSQSMLSGSDADDEDMDFVPISDALVEDASSESSDSDDSGAASCSEEESVHGTSEGESGSEGEDGESEGVDQ